MKPQTLPIAAHAMSSEPERGIWNATPTSSIASFHPTSATSSAPGSRCRFGPATTNSTAKLKSFGNAGPKSRTATLPSSRASMTFFGWPLSEKRWMAASFSKSATQKAVSCRSSCRPWRLMSLQVLSHPRIPKGIVSLVASSLINTTARSAIGLSSTTSTGGK